MPKILDRLVKQLMDKWKPKAVAYAIATKVLQKSWNLQKWTNKATKKWEKRWNMTPAERAKDRAAKLSWNKKSDYKYNKNNNTATLRKRIKKFNT